MRLTRTPDADSRVPCTHGDGPGPKAVVRSQCTPVRDQSSPRLFATFRRTEDAHARHTAFPSHAIGMPKHFCVISKRLVFWSSLRSAIALPKVRVTVCSSPKDADGNSILKAKLSICKEGNKKNLDKTLVAHSDQHQEMSCSMVCHMRMRRKPRHVISSGDNRVVECWCFPESRRGDSRMGRKA